MIQYLFKDNYYTGLFSALFGLVAFGFSYADKSVTGMLIGMFLFYTGWKESSTTRQDKGTLRSGLGHICIWILVVSMISALFVVIF